jgi:hypothetical protein
MPDVHACAAPAVGPHAFQDASPAVLYSCRHQVGRDISFTIASTVLRLVPGIPPALMLRRTRALESLHCTYHYHISGQPPQSKGALLRFVLEFGRECTGNSEAVRSTGADCVCCSSAGDTTLTEILTLPSIRRERWIAFLSWFSCALLHMHTLHSDCVEFTAAGTDSCATTTTPAQILLVARQQVHFQHLAAV